MYSILLNPYDDEPLEVSILKKQLVNLSCKCSACVRASECQSVQTESNTEEYGQSDKLVQVENYLYGEPITQESDKFIDRLNSKLDFLANSISCPGCYVAYNLIKLKENKVFKDEETGTNLSLPCCDKSVGKCAQFLDRGTTTSSNDETCLINSPSSFSDKVINTVLNGIITKRSIEHVTFPERQLMFTQDLQDLYGNCFCLQNFVDSIRPPLDNF